jgi:hypothetical protein
MKRPLLSLALIAGASAAMAQPAPPPREGAGARPPRSYPNPSAVIAAEMALSRLSRKKGQWNAMAATATPEAEIFVPQRTVAAGWLKGRASPARPLAWQAHAVWISCDGSTAATLGAWQDEAGRGGVSRRGWFVRFWERQKDGGWKWRAYDGGQLAEPLAEPEMIATHQPDCRSRALMPPPSPAPTGDDVQARYSADNSLRWTTTVRPDMSRSVSIDLWDGQAHVAALRRDAPPPMKIEEATAP